MNILNKQDASKQNSAAHYKNYIVQPTGVYCWNARMFQQCELISIICYINRMKEEKKHDVSWWRESIWQNSTSSHYKNNQHIRNRNFLNIIKKNPSTKNPQRTSCAVIKRKVFPLRWATRHGCLLSPLHINIILKVLSWSIRQLKERRDIEIREKK